MSSKEGSAIAKEWHDAAIDLADASKSDSEEGSIQENQVFEDAPTTSQAKESNENEDGSKASDQSSGMGSFVDAGALLDSDASSKQGSSGISFITAPEDNDMISYSEANQDSSTGFSNASVGPEKTTELPVEVENSTVLETTVVVEETDNSEVKDIQNEGPDQSAVEEDVNKIVEASEVPKETMQLQNETQIDQSAQGTLEAGTATTIPKVLKKIVEASEVPKETMQVQNETQIDQSAQGTLEAGTATTIPKADLDGFVRVEQKDLAGFQTSALGNDGAKNESSVPTSEVLDEKAATANTSVLNGREIQFTLPENPYSGQKSADESDKTCELSGCNSNISRGSMQSQYTYLTTASASTQKHQNTAAARGISDDFSILSETKPGQMTIGLPLMTTLETEEYRKERDRLEMRKIALVEMSNAYKNSDREIGQEGSDNTPTASNSEIVAAMTSSREHGEIEMKSFAGASAALVNENYVMVMDKNFDIDRLIKAGVALLLGGCLSSYFAETTCHFASIEKSIGYYSEAFHLHAGMYEYTSLDSVFTGHAFCLPYDDYYSSTEPIISQIAGKIAIAFGSIAALVMWFYLIFMRSNRCFWNLGILCAALAAIAQLGTFHFFFDDVCSEEICRIGPGSFMAGVAFVCYTLVAREMYRNCPVMQPRLEKTLIQEEHGNSYTAPELV